MKNMEKMHEKRIKRVEAVCEKYKTARHGYSPTPSLNASFLFDVKNGFAWCKNSKVINS